MLMTIFVLMVMVMMVLMSLHRRHHTLEAHEADSADSPLVARARTLTIAQVNESNQQFLMVNLNIKNCLDLTSI